MEGCVIDPLTDGAVLARIRVGLAQAALPDRAAPAVQVSRGISHLQASLGVLEQHAHVGTVVPGFHRSGTFKRRALRLISRIVLKVAQVITVYQRQFNLLAVQCLRGVSGQLERQERNQDQLAERCQRLEDELASLRKIIPAAFLDRDRAPASDLLVSPSPCLPLSISPPSILQARWTGKACA